MKAIGGYFELELSKGDNIFHDTPYVTKSGRASLFHILNLLKPALVHVPYYTCNALLEPFETARVEYRFYEITDSWEPKNNIDLKKGEYFLYINYLDLKRETVSLLSEKYGDKLIVDCTQAFFMKGNGASWFFNSCRKFFGVPDGSYIYPPSGVQLPSLAGRNEDYLTDHLLQRFNGHPTEGYDSFLRNEVLAGQALSGISLLSEYLLSQVNYDETIKRRINNFNFLRENYKDSNHFPVGPLDGNVPMHYPLLPDNVIDKSVLFSQNIFIPTFWKDVLNRNIGGFNVEKKLSGHLLPLPIDHRYDIADMEHIVKALTGMIN